MKITIKYKTTTFLWACIGMYFTIGSIVGLIVSKNFDVASGHKENVRVSCIMALFYGVASVVASFGWKMRKPWSPGLVMALSFLAILYSVKYFTGHNLYSSGATLYVLLIFIGLFSIFTIWTNKVSAQHKDAPDQEPVR